MRLPAAVLPEREPTLPEKCPPECRHRIESAPFGYLGNAATNVVYPFTVVAFAVALLIGDGAAALFSLSLGRGDTKTGNRCGWIALILSVSAGVLLTVALVFVELRRMRRRMAVSA